MFGKVRILEKQVNALTIKVEVYEEILKNIDEFWRAIDKLDKRIKTLESKLDDDLK